LASGMGHELFMNSSSMLKPSGFALAQPISLYVYYIIYDCFL
jgi:hypothetical protein